MRNLKTIFSAVLALSMASHSSLAEEVAGSIYTKSGSEIMRCDIATFKQGPTHMTVVIPDSCVNIISRVYRYNDVSESHWAFWFIDAVSYAGITSGCGGGNFCPDAKVTRAELAAMLVRALGLKTREGMGLATPARNKGEANE